MSFLKKYANRKHKIDTTSTDYRKNPFVPAPEDRPKCLHKGCVNSVAIIRTRLDGSPCYRATGLCSTHHGKAIAKKHGVRSAAEVTAKRQGKTLNEYATETRQATALRAGFDSITDYANSIHPYRKHRLTYCENRDGRLGYKCRCKIRHSAQLQVDHIDGNPSNNKISNLQTLCANCHIVKTHANKDYATEGRKSKGIKR